MDLFRKPYFKYKEANIVVRRNYNEKNSLLPLESRLASMQQLYKRRRSLAPKFGRISKKINEISIFCSDCVPGKIFHCPCLVLESNLRS
jgi:hypothetical protein